MAGTGFITYPRSRNTATLPPFLTRTLPLLMRTILTPRCFSQVPRNDLVFAGVCCITPALDDVRVELRRHFFNSVFHS